MKTLLMIIALSFMGMAAPASADSATCHTNWKGGACGSGVTPGESYGGGSDVSYTIRQKCDKEPK